MTPRGSVDQWRLTPSILDPNSLSFTSFANQIPGYYTPTSGGVNTVYHNQSAGDLHTPGMALQLGTPLSMPLPEGPLGAGPSFDTGFHPHMFQNPGFQQPNSFPVQQQTFAPSLLVHEDSGYVPIEGSPPEGVDSNADMMQQAIAEHKKQQANAYMPAHHSFNEKSVFPASFAGFPLTIARRFRYHVTLNAPTAMVRQMDEIPITYLNKGQAYTLSITDSIPLSPSTGPVKYRTVIRISFEDDEQRQRPSACWQLWKEGRGLAESHQRGGKLQAVEFVDPHPGAEDDPRKPRLELESSSFDCFVVNWAPPMTATTADCAVAVRFNFLSTDFSHSKGVKGIPVRLCAKTEQISSGTPESPPPASAEVCYCKVKLFRDHGAERKLSNDVAHVKKTIDKLKQQIAQLESGMKDPNKRKRTASMAGKVGGERPGKIAKHKRTWSVSSQGSGGRPAPEEDLHQKLATMQDMFSSTRPASALYLKGADGDDPDLYPVSLPKDPLSVDTSVNALQHRNSWDRRATGEQSETGSSLDSPLASAQTAGERPSSMRNSSSFRPSRPYSGDWPVSATVPGTDYSSGFGGLAGEPTRVRKRRREAGDDGGPAEWIEAVGVDPSYVPPERSDPPPVACFFVRARASASGCPTGGSAPAPFAEDHYRAVYLTQRSVADLVRGIAHKCNIDANRVDRAFRVTSAGLLVLFDDELVREMPEGQDIIVECRERGRNAIKTEAAASSEERIFSTAAEGVPLEMTLFY